MFWKFTRLFYILKISNSLDILFELFWLFKIFKHISRWFFFFSLSNFLERKSHRFYYEIFDSIGSINPICFGVFVVCSLPIESDLSSKLVSDFVFRFRSIFLSIRTYFVLVLFLFSFYRYSITSRLQLIDLHFDTVSLILSVNRSNFFTIHAHLLEPEKDVEGAFKWWFVKPSCHRSSAPTI